MAPREEEGPALCGSRGPAAEGRAARARGGTGRGGGSCFSALLTAPVRSQPRSPGLTTTPSSGSSARKSYRPGRTRTSEERAALGSSGGGAGVEAVGTGVTQGMWGSMGSTGRTLTGVPASPLWTTTSAWGGRGVRNANS